VLATVNGTPITEADVRYASQRRVGHQSNGTSTDPTQVLEGTIAQELIYQRALELGLDADPSYQTGLRQLEAQVNAFKRKKMAALYHQREVVAKASVSDEEARAYFEQHAAQIRTEVNVWQILRRDESQIEQIHKDLAQGLPFEDVAAKHFPTVPPTARKPWELGYLRWEQIPESWRDVVYGLSAGEASGVIRGPNNRFWIIKLVDKRDNPAITYEAVKPRIMKMLTNEKVQRLSDQSNRVLREKAQIVYTKPQDRKN